MFKTLWIKTTLTATCPTKRACLRPPHREANLGFAALFFCSNGCDMLSTTFVKTLRLPLLHSSTCRPWRTCKRHLWGTTQLQKWIFIILTMKLVMQFDISWRNRAPYFLNLSRNGMIFRAKKMELPSDLGIWHATAATRRSAVPQRSGPDRQGPGPNCSEICLFQIQLILKQLNKQMENNKNTTLYFSEQISC